MICPTCGKELKEGNMYCETCGHEINLVPEFEAEVEASMAESIKNIADDVAPKENTEEPVEEQPKMEEKAAKKKSSLGFYLSGGTLAVVGFLAAAVIFGGITVWNNSTFVHEMAVEYYLDDGNVEKAIYYMEEAMRKAPEKAAYRFKLCELYMEYGQEEKALEMYKIIAGSSQFTFDEQIVAVECIIAYYEEAEDYESIAEYLGTIQDKNIQLAFYKYMCSTVSFSQPEGTYASLITLKLETDGLGKIHYTTDGTIPDKNSPEFTNTIFLEAGDNTISAVFINEYGVSSQVVTKNYFIESKKVSPPAVVTYSGTYNCPVEIVVEVVPGTSVYYTTDGTAPNRSSKLYTGSLHVPLGKSVYKFVAMDAKGEVSEIITRDFQITLDTEMTVEDAQMILVNHLALKNGKEIDGRGHIIQDDTHLYVYEYLYAMSVEVGKDCYYFAEVSRDTLTGEQYRTGNYFGVDIRTEEIYAFTQ